MGRTQSAATRIVSVALFAVLGVSLVAGGGQGTTWAEAPRSAPPTPGSEQVFKTLVTRVYFRDTAERDRLATELGAEEVGTTGGFLTAFMDRNTYNNLLSRGLRVEIDLDETRKANDPNIWRDTFYGGYKTVEEMQTFLDQKVVAYPNLAEKIDIGDSWCKTHLGQCTQPNSWNGFDLWALHITNRNIAGPKPVFWYDAGIHAREIGTPELAMRYIDWLLDGYGVNPDATWLVDYQDIWVMPTINPDGHHMVESGGNSPTAHRRNADKDDGCSSYDLFGTDINRNFPFKWGCCGGSSPDPCDDTFRGPAEGTEEETVAMMAKVMELIPDQRGPGDNDPAPITTTGTLINMHSNAALNLYPWGWTSVFAPNRTDMRNIGLHMSAANAGGNGYQACQNTECLYIVDGDEKNWGYGVLGIPSYSLEISGANFYPPYSQIESLWNLNRGALVYHAKIARQPYLITRGPDANTVAANPLTVTRGTTSNLGATINYAWTGNQYNQNVAAAEYYIDTPPWTGGTAIPMAAVDGSFNSPTEAVQADVDTSSLAPGRHILFVRGRGVNDYSGFQSWGPISAAFLDVVGSGTPIATSTPTSSPTHTPTDVPTNTPSNTPIGSTPTNTSVANTPTNTRQPSGSPTAVPTPCAITFTDVHADDYFYEPVTYLYCHRAISGYSDNTFRPGNNTTRGQLSKIVVLAEGWAIYTPTTPTFRDVPTTDTFYQYVETAYDHSIISGYYCGSGCLEFRPGNNVTRAQLTKIVVLAESWEITPPATPTFRDVPLGDAFYGYIETAYSHSIISGYDCGTGCLEFRPGNNATRGQISKIVYLAVTGP
ncbi:MAG: M14 family zinc carboxypeptidase [Chloroflexia bacterium]